MKYVKQVSAALLALTFCLSAAGCGASGNTASIAPESSAAQEQATEAAQEQATEAAQEQATEAAQENDSEQAAGDAQNDNASRTALVTLSGVPLIYNQTSYEELLSSGWVPFHEYAEEIVEKNTALSGLTLKNDSCPGINLEFSVVNTTDEEITVANSFLCDFKVQRAGSDSAAGTEIGLPCGLTMASSLDEVKAALGTEAEDLTNDQEPELSQYKFTYKVDGEDYYLKIFFKQSDTSNIYWVDYTNV